MGNHGPAKALTPRDRAVLDFVGCAGLAAIPQIHARHWSGCSEQAARDRLRQLARAGYVELKYSSVRGYAERVVVLTRQGREVFAPAARQHLRVGLPPLAEQKQQLLAQEARVRLEQQIAAQGGRVVAWTDERALKGELVRAQRQGPLEAGSASPYECPDARMVVENADGSETTYAIEIDGQYYGKMLAGKLKRFGQQGGPVLYVCEPGRATKVSRAAARYANIQVMSLGGGTHG